MLVALFALGLLVQALEPKPAVTAGNATATGTTTDNTSGATAAVAAAAPANWTYSEDKDAMRGTTTYHAIVDSADKLNLPFPYGPDITAHIDIRKRPKDGLLVMFTVDKGQVLCSDYGGHRLHLKFDDGPVKAFGCENASDGTSQVAFINSPATVLAKLKSAKRLMVEAEFFDAGSQQLTFNVAGLKWSH